jgi:hypothetical protein
MSTPSWLTKQQNSMLQDLAQVFDTLCSTRMMLNSEKCVFNISTGRLLDFLILHWGIKANPEKQGQSRICGLHPTSRMFKSSRVVLPLNSEKCVFDISTGRLLDFLILHWGIKANPEKTRAIKNMRHPSYIKDVQKLMGCLAALRFI